MSFPRLIARLPRSCASSLARAPVCARTYAASTSIPTPSAPVPASQPTAASPSDVQQAPNHAQTWSTSQAPKPGVYADVRFTQTRLDMQPAAPSAMQMVSEDPVRLVNARRATCDGGGGPLGHPKIYINLDKPGPKACGYCGIRFEQAHHDHHPMH